MQYLVITRVALMNKPWAVRAFMVVVVSTTGLVSPTLANCRRESAQYGAAAANTVAFIIFRKIKKQYSLRTLV